MYETNTVNGTTINRSQGFETVGIIIDAKTNKTFWIAVRKVLGRISSRQPTSFEKRLRILPTGFESNNRTGAFKIATTILS